MNKTKKADSQVMENKLVVSSGERKAGERHYRGRGLRRRGYYGIIENHVCETSENFKAL